MLPIIPLYPRLFFSVKPTQRPDSDVSLTQHKSAGVCEHNKVDTRAARATPNESFSPASPAIVKDASGCTVVKDDGLGVRISNPIDVTTTRGATFKSTCVIYP